MLDPLLAFADRFLCGCPEESTTLGKIDVNRLLVPEDVQNTLEHRGRQMHLSNASAVQVGLIEHA
jgi:hypothetical protein